MAYVLYGLTAAEVTVAANGDVVAGKPGRVYTTPVGGSPFTDIKAANFQDINTPGASLNGQFVSNDDGRIGFYAPGGTGTLWIDWQDGKARWAVNPTLGASGDIAGAVAQAVTTAGVDSSAKDATVLASAKSYADGKDGVWYGNAVSTAAIDAAAKAAQALLDAKAYTDSKPSGGGGGPGVGVGIEGSLSTSDPFPTDSQALAAYGEGGYFTYDDPTLLRSPGSSTDATDLIRGALSFIKSVELGHGTFLVSGYLGDVTGLFCGKSAGSTFIRISSGYKGGQRLVLDGTVTINSNQAGSVTGGFTTGHVGTRINATGVPADTTITAVAGDGKSATMSAVATATGAGLSMAFGNPLITARKGATIRNIGFVGGPSNASCLTNPDVGAAISIGLGGSFVTLRDLDFNYVNGWCVESLGQLVGAPYYLVADGIRGTYCGGGIHLQGISSSNFGAQVTMDHLNLQIMERYSVLWFDWCNDIQIGKVNGAVAGNVYGAHGLLWSGNGSSLMIDNFDVGSYPTVPGVEPIIKLTGTPNNLWIKSGVAQGGLHAVQVDGGFHLHFNLQYSRSAGSAVLINGGDKMVFEGTWTRNGFVQPRVITDFVTTSGSATASSPGQAGFTQSDLYAIVVSPGVVSGTYIAAVAADGKSITLSAAATANGSGVTATLGVWAEIQQTTNAPAVDVLNPQFATPAVWAAGQGGVPGIFRAPSSANNTVIRGGRVLGGHTWANAFPGGQSKIVEQLFGMNPYGYFGSSTMTLPASGSNMQGTAVPRMVYMRAGTADFTMTLKLGLGGQAEIPITVKAGELCSFFQPPGTAWRATYTGAATDATAPTIVAVVGN